MKQDAAIVGVGATPYYFRGESAPQTLYELIGKAILAAVADAGSFRKRARKKPIGRNSVPAR